MHWIAAAVLASIVPVEPGLGDNLEKQAGIVADLLQNISRDNTGHYRLLYWLKLGVVMFKFDRVYGIKHLEENQLF